MQLQKAKIKIALQKKGRLKRESLSLLNSRGFNFQPSPNPLIDLSTNFPLELLFVRDDDIPQLVQSGAADFGIVGENVLYEYLLDSTARITIEQRLTFCNCRLSLAAPKNTETNLSNQRIATSYPQLLQQYLNTRDISAQIVPMSGSVELAVQIGLADWVCDLVSTGRTLAENGLSERETILESEAVLISTQRKCPVAKRFLNILNQPIEVAV